MIVGGSFYPNVTTLLFRFLLSLICLSSVMFVRPTQRVETCVNISSLFFTVAILWLCAKFYGDRTRGTLPLGC